MISAIVVDIEHPEIISNYADLVRALDTKDSKAQSDITFKMEKIIAKTLFRGISIKGGGAGVSNPDFLVTNDSLNAVLNKMNKSQEIDAFNAYVAKTYGSVGTPVEAKILRNDVDKNIKLGIFTPNITTENSKYFDFLTGDIFDASKHSIINDLRRSYKEDPDIAPPSQKELKKNIKRSDLQSFIKTTSPDFKKVVLNDLNVKALDKILSKSPQEKMNTPEVVRLVDEINNKWAKTTLEGELTRLSKTGKLFDYITSIPALKSQFYMKSRMLSILRMDNNKAKALVLHFPLSSFNSTFFGAKYNEDQIKVYIKSGVEKEFLKQLADSTATLTLTDNLDAYDQAVKRLVGNSTFKPVNLPSFNTTINYLVPTGGSIPMSTSNVFNVKRKYKRPPFFGGNGSQVIGKYSTANNFTKGTMLSSEFLTLLVRKKVVETMPRGPIGGRPLSDTMLTYRTGRFANSIELHVNYRTRVLRYYYNPIYYIHEATTRNPNNLIKQSIYQIMQERFNRPFAIQHERD